MAALKTDVLVVGAGPAGCAAAIAVKRGQPSLKVTLVDKAVFPRDKVCGDGIGPGVVSVLEDLGITHVVDGETPISLCEVTGPQGAHFVTTLPKVKGRQLTGYVIPRLTFDDRLRRAAENAGAIFLSEHHFSAIRTSSTSESTLDFETPEVCQTLGITVTNCNVILHRARNALRQCLQRGWFTDGAAPC